MKAQLITGGVRRTVLPSVRARLVAMLIISALCIGLVSLLGLFGLRSGQQAADRLILDGVDVVARMGDLRAAFSGMARYEMDMLVNFESPPLTDAAKREWKASHEFAQVQLKGLSSNLPDQQAQQLLGTIVSGIDSYKKGLDELIPRLERGEVLSAGVGNQLMLEHRKGYSSAEAAVDVLQTSVREHVVNLAKTQKTNVGSLTMGLAAAAAAGLTAAMVIGWLIVRAIQRQLGDALALTQRIAGGNLQEEPMPADEGEIGRIVDSLGRMRAELRILASGVKSSAADVATSSSEIAQGSCDLSARTEEAAALLQQLSVGLQQVDELAASSVKDAAAAAELAKRMAADAQTSMEASTEAVQSMNTVTHEADRIAEITEVINGIAFRTNMLALNAAVEAARAGEQGKGFAVVAEEVRGLAQRAADAAKDIQALLQSSRASVQSSNSAVRSAAIAVQSVGSTANVLAHLTCELVAKSKIQTQCIAVVSGNASSLDATGQHNSALAEQTHAASESLQSQAASLRALVETFRV